MTYHEVQNQRGRATESGKPLWDIQLGGAVRANPMSFAVDGKQYVAIAAGYALFVFGLP